MVFQENEAARIAASAQSRLADQVAEVRQRLDRIEERLPTRIEAEVVATRRVLGG